MKKINEIISVLKFYMVVNKLKSTPVDIKSKYSKADSIYGSSILAIAFNSEFKTNYRVADIIKMELLYELSYFPEFYGAITSMKKGARMEDLLIEFNANKSPNAKLAHEYKSLDKILTKIFDKTKSLEEFIDESLEIMDRKNKDNLINILKFYYNNHLLKLKARSGWDKKHWNIQPKDGRVEMISDHIIGTIGFAYAMGSNFQYDFDYNDAIETLLIHEIGEISIGDITPFDNISIEEKREMEHKAMRNILGNLSDAEVLYQKLLEFDDCKTPLDRFTHYCDKIDADLQSKVYLEKGYHHSLDNQENNVVMKSSKVKKMISDGLAKDAFDIWYYYDKSIYEHDKSIPEFFDILKFVKINSLFDLNKRVVKEEVELNKLEYEFLTEEINYELNKIINCDDIESIFFTNFQNDKKGKIVITIIYNSTKASENELKELTEYFRSKNLTQVDVEFKGDYTYGYHVYNYRPKDYRKLEDLMEATIIYDRHGLMNSLKTQAKEYFSGHLYQQYNLVDFYPPIEEKIILLKKTK